jgi:PHD/YefM family antitoxin component YafN of YafNO toxin-antitoxin module
MKLMRGAAAFGAAKMVYDQVRKPENQAKLRSLMAQVKQSRERRTK